MARRHRVQISLFPFMSILACTIGVLTMLLAVLSLSAVGASRASEQAEARSEFQRTREAEALAALRAPITEAEEAWRSVDRALIERGLAPGLPLPRIEYALERVREAAGSQRKLQQLKSELRKKQKEREGLEASIAVLESRQETLPILVDPTGLSKRWKPFFIECDAGGATAYRATDDFEYFVPQEELATSGDFGRYLRRVRVTPGALLVLLVRPDGIATARKTEGLAKGALIRVARLPLAGTGELDWSLLRKAEDPGVSDPERG